MFTALFIIQDSDLLVNLRQACESVRRGNGENFTARLFSTAETEADAALAEEFFECAKRADFIYIELHGGTPYFPHFARLEREYLRKVPFFLRSGLDDENAVIQKISPLPQNIYARLLRYHMAGGLENCLNLVRCMLYTVAGIEISFGEPVFSKTEGIYGLPPGVSEEEYLNEAAADGRTVIGVIVHYHYVRSHNTKHIDALAEALRCEGALPLIIYTNMVPDNGGGLRSSLKKYFLNGEDPLVDAVIVTVGFSLSLISAPGSTTGGEFRSVFEELDVPVLQALTTPYSYEQWRASLTGLSPMYLSSSIFQPEFDGQIISLPLACTEKETTPGGTREVCRPIPDRAGKIARTAVNWGRLRKIPAKDKKIAIIFHNMPPRIDMIGCAYGLDSHESVFALCEKLAALGIRFDRPFSSGKEIIDRITAGATNDTRFLSPDELMDRSEALMEPDGYRIYFDSLPEENRDDLTAKWGNPPGEYMTAGGKILIPGIVNGSVFIGLQPPRAFTEKAEEAYHSTDIVCPHQYIAFYRWLKEGFGAHVVVHVGTHGTIEWLPGKETALSRECWPDIAIDDLPNLYPYTIDVPGEGAQAKRRISAVIIDHLIPAMDESGLYGDLAVIEGDIEQYYHAKQADRGKMAEIAAEIASGCQKAGLFRELSMTEEAFFADRDSAIEKIHMLLSGIKSTKIKDGLHVLGRGPDGRKLPEMMRLLLAIRNDNIPSLREGAATAVGKELDELLSAPEKTDAEGYTNAMRLAALDEKTAELFRLWQERSFAKKEIEPLLKQVFGGGDIASLTKTLEYARDDILPRLKRTSEELEYFIRGVCGRFVIPGPSGSPSRGGVSLLPTGRNFYSIDPTCVPSRAAWRTGVRLAESLLEKYKRENGAVPESAAIVVYSGDTMKTRGDDIAEIMYLYGIRPVWLAATDRVIGLEAIPLKELGRPRIDVTLRISGLFRDTFPNLIERIEDAVNMAAALDEAPEDNFIKKHINEDIQTLVKKGLPIEEARADAAVRVFGCPPGTYGAGVDIMVQSKKWQNAEDLGGAYVNWSAHGYTKKIHGRKMTETFVMRLSKCALTVKNISSYESDMLDDDDYYGYHGGLISAVTTASGKAPTALNASSADPERIDTKTIQEETAKIIRARACNPKWIGGLKEHGFRGAQEFSAMLDIAFGWDATAGVVEDWMYDKIADTYLLDAELRSWIKENNRWALHAMAERMLEAQARGMWDADEERLARIKELYLETDGELEGI